MLLDEGPGLGAGAEARRTYRVLDVPVGDGLLGRVVDPVGRPLDNAGAVKAAATRTRELSRRHFLYSFPPARTLDPPSSRTRRGFADRTPNYRNGRAESGCLSSDQSHLHYRWPDLPDAHAISERCSSGRGAPFELRIAGGRFPLVAGWSAAWTSTTFHLNGLDATDSHQPGRPAQGGRSWVQSRISPEGAPAAVGESRNNFPMASNKRKDLCYTSNRVQVSAKTHPATDPVRPSSGCKHQAARCARM